MLLMLLQGRLSYVPAGLHIGRCKIFAVLVTCFGAAFLIVDIHRYV